MLQPSVPSGGEDTPFAEASFRTSTVTSTKSSTASPHTNVPVVINRRDRLRIQGARAKILDVDHTLLRKTLDLVHDGHQGRHARAAAEILRSKSHTLPVETRESVSRALERNDGLLFSESEWGQRYRSPFTGISEEVTCLGISSQLAKDFPGLSLSMQEFRLMTGRILAEQRDLFIGQTGPTPGSQRLLQQLVDYQIPSAVVTGSPEHFIRPALEAHGLGAVLSSGANLFEATKKTGAPILECVSRLAEERRLPLTPGDCIMIGDQPTDALAALLAGVRQVILVPDTEDFESGAFSLEGAIQRYGADGLFGQNSGAQVTIVRSLEQLQLLPLEGRNDRSGVELSFQ